MSSIQSNYEEIFKQILKSDKDYQEGSQNLITYLGEESEEALKLSKKIFKTINSLLTSSKRVPSRLFLSLVLIKDLMENYPKQFEEIASLEILPSYAITAEQLTKFSIEENLSNFFGDKIVGNASDQQIGKNFFMILCESIYVWGTSSSQNPSFKQCYMDLMEKGLQFSSSLKFFKSRGLEDGHQKQLPSKLTTFETGTPTPFHLNPQYNENNNNYNKAQSKNTEQSNLIGIQWQNDQKYQEQSKLNSQMEEKKREKDNNNHFTHNINNGQEKNQQNNYVYTSKLSCSNSVFAKTINENIDKFYQPYASRISLGNSSSIRPSLGGGGEFRSQIKTVGTTKKKPTFGESEKVKLAKGENSLLEMQLSKLSSHIDAIKQSNDPKIRIEEQRSQEYELQIKEQQKIISQLQSELDELSVDPFLKTSSNLDNFVHIDRLNKQNELIELRQQIKIIESKLHEEDKLQSNLFSNHNKYQQLLQENQQLKAQLNQIQFNTQLERDNNSHKQQPLSQIKANQNQSNQSYQPQRVSSHPIFQGVGQNNSPPKNDNIIISNGYGIYEGGEFPKLEDYPLINNKNNHNQDLNYLQQSKIKSNNKSPQIFEDFRPRGEYENNLRQSVEGIQIQSNKKSPKQQIFGNANEYQGQQQQRRQGNQPFQQVSNNKIYTDSDEGYYDNNNILGLLNKNEQQQQQQQVFAYNNNDKRSPQKIFDNINISSSPPSHLKNKRDEQHNRNQNLHHQRDNQLYQQKQLNLSDEQEGELVQNLQLFEMVKQNVISQNRFKGACLKSKYSMYEDAHIQIGVMSSYVHQRDNNNYFKVQLYFSNKRLSPINNIRVTILDDHTKAELSPEFIEQILPNEQRKQDIVILPQQQIFSPCFISIIYNGVSPIYLCLPNTVNKTFIYQNTHKEEFKSSFKQRQFVNYVPINQINQKLVNTYSELKQCFETLIELNPSSSSSHRSNREEKQQMGLLFSIGKSNKAQGDFSMKIVYYPDKSAVIFIAYDDLILQEKAGFILNTFQYIISEQDH